MTILLKIILIILAIACGFIFALAIREYRIWIKSQQAIEASVVEKALINAMAYIVFIASVCTVLSSLAFVFSEITIKLPF